MPQSRFLQPFLDKLMSRSILTDKEQAAVLGLSGMHEHLPAHYDFVDRGEEQISVCLVIDGLCARMGQTIAGERQITAFHMSGDMPDLHSVMVPGATSALLAVCASQIVRIPCHKLRAVALEHPGIAEALWRDTICDASISAEWIVNVGRRDAVTRIVHLLCEMAVRRARIGGNAFSFAFPCTQQNIADATGLSAVHTNRSIQMLRARHFVEIKDKVVAVLDWKKLQEFAEFDSGYMHLHGPLRFSAVH